MTDSPQILVVATTNPGKASEFRAILALLLDPTRIRIVTPDELGVSVPSVEETGTTFVENACLKARAYSDATNFPALADDSGLCVDALGGAPGLYSARWAGVGASDLDRMTLLLQELRDTPLGERTARYMCAVAVATPGGAVFFGDGVCEGCIGDAPHGSEGFGYDPIFLVPEFGKTMAELTAEVKNRISHRARAMRSLMPQLLGLGFT